MIQRTDVKDPVEIVPFTADFTYRLAAIDSAETIATITSVTPSVQRGVDPDPSTFVIGGPVLSTDSKKVIQNIRDGLDGVDYKLKVEVVTSSGKDLVIVGVVPVRSK